MTRLRLRAADGPDEPARSAGLETFFVADQPQWSYLSSSLIKEVVRFGGDVSGLVPAFVRERLEGHGSPRASETEHPWTSSRDCSRSRSIVRRRSRCRCPRACSSTGRRSWRSCEAAQGELPEEIKQARWVVKDREELLAKARKRRRADRADAPGSSGRAVSAAGGGARGEGGGRADPGRGTTSRRDRSAWRPRTTSTRSSRSSRSPWSRRARAREVASARCSGAGTSCAACPPHKEEFGSPDDEEEQQEESLLFDGEDVR